jgi:serine/threonine-protein kinase
MTARYCSQGHENSHDSRFCRWCGERLALVNFTHGQLLGFRYGIVQTLGSNSWGQTYLAQDCHRFNELCVLQAFTPPLQEPAALRQARERLEQQANLLYKLKHSQIPRFREIFQAHYQERDRLFLVRDYIEGPTYRHLLQARQQQGRTFSEPEVMQLLFQILPVLDYLHSCNVIHQDLSPDKLVQRQSDGLPALIGFGGLKQASVHLFQVFPPTPTTPSLSVRCSPSYAPLPESLTPGDVTPSDDLSALAVTVLVLLTGQEADIFLQPGPDHWQQQLSLHPLLSGVLDRMLDTQPGRCFQSAREVFDLLNGLPPQPVGEPTRPPLESELMAYTSTGLTQAAWPDWQPGTQAVGVGGQKKRPTARWRSRAWWILPMLVIALAGAGGGGWWLGKWWLPAVQSWLPKDWAGTISPGIHLPGNRANNSNSSTQFSAAERARKQDLQRRREALGIALPFWVDLVDQAFYSQHPELNRRQLSANSADELLRQEWDQLASQFLERLQGLSPAARSRLGQYTTADLKARQSSLQSLKLNPRVLNDLTDAQFFYWFPQQLPGQNLLEQPIGQVWQAIATDQLKALQSGVSLETVQFPPGQFSHQIGGNLKPGEGRVLLANLSQEQVLRLELQATPQQTRLSLYSPDLQAEPLLEDAAAQTWSGQLPASGLYQIVVVSQANQSLHYAIDLAAADDVQSAVDQ